LKAVAVDRVETLVDEVIAAFDARRRGKWNATTMSLTGASGELRQWWPLVEARIKAFRHSLVDRAALLARARQRFGGKEWSADFAGVADELQNMSRDELQRHLVDNGMPAEAARQVAEGYSIGALLHDL
jgi:hypothetical protein